MLARQGHGLQLVPHNLNNGEIQFEGYDKHNKHLFTFRLRVQGEIKPSMPLSSGTLSSSNGPQDKRLTRSSSTHNGSDFSDESESRIDKTMLGSLVDCDKLTEYEAAEKLLDYQKQMSIIQSKIKNSISPSGGRNTGYQRLGSIPVNLGSGVHAENKTNQDCVLL